VLFFGLVIWRRPMLRAPNKLESVLSREAGFVVNNWLFMGLLAIVFWGTLYPKISEWLVEREILLGPGWFTNVAAVVALPLLLLTGIGPLIAWRRATPASLRRQLRIPTASGVLTAAALGVLTRDAFQPIALVVWGLGAFVTATVTQEYVRAIRARMRHGEGPFAALVTLFRKNQRRYGGYVVHLGVVFLFVGFAGAALNEERLETLSPGDAVTMNGYRLEYKTAQAIPAQHFGGAVARIALFEHGRPLATLVPEKRMYWLEQQPASIPAVWSTLNEDLYVILTAIEADGAATLKIRRNPLVSWVWLGGLTFVLGTALVMWPHATPRRASNA
jgi:cytochrome c-type biogenesis protein CcmF